MPKHYIQKLRIEFVDKVQAQMEKDIVTVTGPKGVVTKVFSNPGLNLTIEQSGFYLSSKKANKKTQALFYTWGRLLRNMITGVTEGFQYEMKSVYSHFPMKVQVVGSVVEIENFLGEAVPRKARIIGDTKVNISGEMLKITGINKEHVGQTAANIEQATRIKRVDPRVFQDGIYIIAKG